MRRWSLRHESRPLWPPKGSVSLTCLRTRCLYQVQRRLYSSLESLSCQTRKCIFFSRLRVRKCVRKPACLQRTYACPCHDPTETADNGGIKSAILLHSAQSFDRFNRSHELQSSASCRARVVYDVARWCPRTVVRVLSYCLFVHVHKRDQHSCPIDVAPL